MIKDIELISYEIRMSKNNQINLYKSMDFFRKRNL